MNIFSERTPLIFEKNYLLKLTLSAGLTVLFYFDLKGRLFPKRVNGDTLYVGAYTTKFPGMTAKKR